MPRSASSRHRSTIRSGGSPSSPVSATIRSVPPAIGRAGPAARTAYASARSRGLETGGSTGIGSAPDAAAGQPRPDGEQRGDDPEPDRELLRRQPAGQVGRRRAGPGRSALGRGRRRRRGCRARRPAAGAAWPPAGAVIVGTACGRLPLVGTAMRSGSELMRRLLGVIRSSGRRSRRWLEPSVAARAIASTIFV